MPVELPPEIRAKLDPRLSLFLRLGARRLHDLKVTEQAWLAELEEEMLSAREVRSEASSTSEIEAAEVTIAAIRKRLFAPLTTGYYEPTDEESPGPWHTEFEEPFVSGFIVSTMSAKDLRDLGVVVRQQIGDLFTALIAMSEIEALANLGSIRSIELDRALFPSAWSQKRLELTGIKPLHDLSITGKGVIVGIIDIWLDFDHQDFKASKNTRVISFWDQSGTPPKKSAFPSSSPKPPLSFKYGVEYDQQHIQYALNQSNWSKVLDHTPGNPHGTEVTGCAAGGGIGQAEARGAAPDSDIIFVRCIDLAGELAISGPVMDAFQYIFDKATALGQPCVVNLSYNDQLGPHDGTSKLDAAFEYHLKTNGRAITISAGNENLELRHVNSSTAGTVDDTLRQLAELASPDAVCTIDIWYFAGDEFDIQIECPVPDPAGNTTTTIGPVHPGGPVVSTQLLPTLPDLTLDIQSDLKVTADGDNRIRITFVPVGSPIIPAVGWKISLQRSASSSASGVFHAWIHSESATWVNPTQDHSTVAEPATGPDAITVGEHFFPDPDTIQISGESGCGPTRRSSIPDKPDLVAWGQFVMVPVPTGTGYMLDGGTSLTAPLVAGACALLFDSSIYGPDVSGYVIKDYLKMNADKYLTTIDQISPPDEMYGHGHLWLPGLPPPPRPWKPDFDVWLKESDLADGFEPYGGSIIWDSPDMRLLKKMRKGTLPPGAGLSTDPRHNSVEVVVRNRGRKIARDVDVYLYWGGPSTYLPFPQAWQSTGIFTGKPRSLAPKNRIRINEIKPGRSKKVRFAWSPILRSNGPCAEDHYSFLARLECDDDPSQLDGGGWISTSEKNNIAVRNVLERKLDSSSGASMTFLIEAPWPSGPIGSKFGRASNSLRIRSRLRKGEIGLGLPVECLPWRRLAHLEKHGGKPAPFGAAIRTGPRLEAPETLVGKLVQEITDITGAVRLDLKDGRATILAGDRGEIFVPSLQLAPGAVVPVTIRVEKAGLSEALHCVHATHLCGGHRLGGVTLELRR